MTGQFGFTSGQGWSVWSEAAPVFAVHVIPHTR